MRVSLKWKFTWFLAALLLFTIVILSFLVLNGVSHYQQKQMEAMLARQVQTAQTQVTQQYASGTQVSPRTFLHVEGQKLAVEAGATSGMRVILYDADGTLVGDSLPMTGRAEVQDALQAALDNKIAYITEGDSLQYLAPVYGPDGQLGVIQLQTSLTDQHAFYQQLLWLFLSVGAAVLLISFLFGLFYMNRQARAIARLKTETDRIRKGKYSSTPALARQDELGELGQGIFEMSQAIESSIRSQKQFINNISHEFKTPLTSIKAYADLLHMYGDDPAMIRESSEAIQKESSRLYELVETALRLAALETYEFAHQPERVDVHALLEDLCARLNGKANQQGITFHTQLQPASIWADRASMVHILLNLLDNAIKYNTQHGTVTAITRRHGSQVEIIIRDTGIGIPEEAKQRIFEPFYTVHADRARQSGGTGLGLALVHQLVEKQNGQIRIEDGPDGRGTSVMLRFDAYFSDGLLQV
ncbi:sensor histidine kinase [Brevibacillus nitrificans]|uniref:sensor histidine kinase n=1 Tax=Brevibacillus nitrificans TaxID=651560 RepID=UPI0026231C02|nr:HAMP domain-containing sensor histidine kinase [Brevibacillus nitrificans]